MRAILLLPLLLAACGGAPTHFFVLQANRPAAVAGATATGRASPITVQHVVIAPELDRLGIVSYGRDGRLHVSHQNRWGAPLGQMIQSVVAADLGSLLPGQVLAPGVPEPPGQHRRLAITIRHFAADSAGRVKLVADWTLLDRNSMPETSHTTEIIARASSPAPVDTVPAMDRALAALSGKIARSMGGAPRPSRPARGG